MTAAASKPTLTIYYSRPAPGEPATDIYATADPGDGHVTHIDLEFSDYLIQTVTKVAEAFGAEALEVNVHLRPAEETP